MKQKILIVDDDFYLRKILRDFLEAKDFEISEAGTGEEGLEKCQSENPHLVLLDILLPGELGLTVAFDLTSNAFPSGKPKIIVISAALGEGGIDPNDYKKFGGLDIFLKKPLNMEELLVHIQKLLD